MINKQNIDSISLSHLFPDRCQGLSPKVLDDLLNRTQFEVLVIGGAGSIGSTIVKMILKAPNSKLAVIDNDESRLHKLVLGLTKEQQQRIQTFVCDIRDLVGLRSIMNLRHWDWIINAAALKHVSVLEDQPRQAYLTNILGAANVLKAMENTSFKCFLFVSSDKAANPINVLGKTKLVGEYMSAHFSKLFNSDPSQLRNISVVRFGNVFLSRGSVVETFIHQLTHKQKVTLTDRNMKRFFMDVSDASSMVIRTLLDSYSGIRILKMGSPIYIVDLINRLAEFLGEQVTIEEIGIKPGEKLNEELMSENETLVDTNEMFWDLSFTKTFDFNRVFEDRVIDDTAARERIDWMLKEAHGI